MGIYRAKVKNLVDVLSPGEKDIIINVGVSDVRIICLQNLLSLGRRQQCSRLNPIHCYWYELASIEEFRPDEKGVYLVARDTRYEPCVMNCVPGEFLGVIMFSFAKGLIQL